MRSQPSDQPFIPLGELVLPNPICEIEAGHQPPLGGDRDPHKACHRRVVSGKAHRNGVLSKVR